jgi:phenylalanyl-tRNA synthetase alpha chain
VGEGLKPEEFESYAREIGEAFRQEWEGRFMLFAHPLEEKWRAALEENWLGSSLLDRTKAALKDLADLDTRMLGKKGGVTKLGKMVGLADTGYRAVLGQRVQAVKGHVEAALRAAEDNLEQLKRTLSQERERIDVTLPGRRPRHGHIHPITKLRERIEDIFVSLGYAIEDDREIETDFYNFDALNIPANHPARAPQDTFYTTEGFALRSQTSTVQIHAMQRRGAPLRMIAPGRVFRRDTPDPTHNPMFFQVEGLCVDRGITMAHLKGTVAEFLRRMFGAQTVTRFRPSYFPFTEPSAEFDFSCFKCGGSGCRICKQSGWIELGGSGMVHPNVLRIAGVDPEIYSGFAFGLGIDRMCALMYGLDDIRLLFENDVRFLDQFD